MIYRGMQNPAHRPSVREGRIREGTNWQVGQRCPVGEWCAPPEIFHLPLAEQVFSSILQGLGRLATPPTWERAWSPRNVHSFCPDHHNHRHA